MNPVDVAEIRLVDNHNKIKLKLGCQKPKPITGIFQCSINGTIVSLRRQMSVNVIQSCRYIERLDVEKENHVIISCTMVIIYVTITCF